MRKRHHDIQSGSAYSRHRIAGAVLMALLYGCSALLPQSTLVTQSPWKNFREAQETFDRIVPGKSTAADLKELGLDPESNSNITLLNYSDVLRRFIPGPSISADDLDAGVRECISAKTVCRGIEIDQRSIERQRYGNFWADFLNFRRKVDVKGWRFTGLVLLKDGVVVYKLTGGQPDIREYEQSKNPLGPLQGLGESRLLNAF